MRNGPKTECSKWKHQRDRQKPRSSYCLLTRPVCKDAFLFLLGISQDLLTRLHKHYQAEGLTPSRRKTGGRKNNTRCLTFNDTARVVRFIKNYAEDHAVCLPGRVPGFKREDIRLLPSSSPKSCIYRLYAEHATANGYRQVGKSTFGKLWGELCPFIVVARPMTDLCWRCQRNNTRIYRSANLTMEEKNVLLLEQQAHLSQVEGERQLYREMTADAKDVAHQRGLQQLQPTRANSGDFAMHYSFDFAQQVHYPSDAAQPGPLYFLTPRKCGIFGVHCEGLSQQVNFLIDEAVSSSKGSNAVISYMHYFFANYGLGEKSIHLHCDNCAGQNKNRWMLFYFAWRVQVGLHSAVTINFMPPGHTKFAPDWCFGLLKRRFRRAHVSCLDDLQDVVKESTPVSRLNIPQLVGSEDATVIVPTYDWHSFFTPAYKPLPGIKPIGHFRFDSQHPGKVFYKTMIADAEKEMMLAVPDQVAQLPRMPAIIPPAGLSRERQQYLFQHIREYVRDDKRDIVCPRPAHHI